MIRNNLATLLAERSLKITKVASETGISRNTITSTAQNDGKMIQLETINVLCQFLNVTPAQFFDYLPYDFDTKTYLTKTVFKEDPYGPDVLKELEADLFLEKTSHTPMSKKEFDFIVKLKAPVSADEDDPFLNNDLTMRISILLSDKKQVKSLSDTWLALPAGFKDDLKTQIMTQVGSDLRKQMIESDKISWPDQVIDSIQMLFSFDFESDLLPF
ncbi:helix-turn-helix domain-containing protein [Lacticaseibacillus rhamnosus]|uniref:helix-turn-helix domain-containing protein n=1 Tax=Lacticaseibacillus rhamnosus TaxID=47715 RepID=UPI00237F5556|nr:helix-turn-helix transcriptional regulator [Lacticaseibacillus rhamnosus]MDE3295707.1 helix-turn-helix transcriptional regulator [Lacticaseibacillus rhamnosus]